MVLWSFVYIGTKHSKISPKYIQIYYDYSNLYIDVDLSENETSQLILSLKLDAAKLETLKQGSETNIVNFLGAIF